MRPCRVNSALALGAALVLAACSSAVEAGPQGPKGDTGATGAKGDPGDPAPLVAGCQAGESPQWNGAAWQCVAGPACTTVTLSNRNGATDKYGKWDLPYDCYPPFMSADFPTSPPTTFGCTIELWVEHHSGNNPQYWRGHRGTNLAIWPNAEGTGHPYIQVWDYSNANLYDMQNGIAEVFLGAHWAAYCDVTDSYYNGAAWTAGIKNPSGPGWQNFGMRAPAYTRCTVRVCENRADPGAYSIAERTTGSTTE